jgi:hypothetical protein
MHPGRAAVFMEAAIFIITVGGIPILVGTYHKWIEPWLWRRQQFREQRRGFEVLPPK